MADSCCVTMEISTPRLLQRGTARAFHGAGKEDSNHKPTQRETQTPPDTIKTSEKGTLSGSDCSAASNVGAQKQASY